MKLLRAFCTFFVLSSRLWFVLSHQSSTNLKRQPFGALLHSTDAHSANGLQLLILQ